MDINKLNDEGLREDLKLRDRIDYILKGNHYVIGKVTAMDLVLISLVFFGAIYILDGITKMQPPVIFIVPAVLCALVECHRIWWRPYRNAHHAEQKSHRIMRILRKYARAAEMYGTEEDRTKVEELIKSHGKFEAIIHEYAELTYMDTLFGYDD